MIFASLREGAAQLFAKSADGTRVVERLTHSETELVRHSISPDGQLLVVEERSSDTGTNLALLSRKGDSETRPLLRTQFTERNAEISPDGRWTAYESNASGRFEMYVQPFPNLDDGKWMVLVDGGTRPLWAPDGRELFFLDDSHLMVVAMENDFSVEPGTRRSCLTSHSFRLRLATTDVAPDGQRFLIMRHGGSADDPSTGHRVVLVQNWLLDLQRLVSAP